MERLVHYEGVDIYRQENLILRSVDLEVKRGELLYIVGKVGSGKSSLLKSFYGEIEVSSGEAHILEFDLQKIKRKQVPLLRRKLGIIFQDFQLLTDRSVSENLEFVLRATGWKRSTDIRTRVDEVLALVGMESKGYKMLHEMSGGEQQRVVIARALLNDPEVILADEPTGNLDEETATQIVELLHKIRERGTAVVMATHGAREFMKQYPGRLLVCEAGELIEKVNIANSPEVL